MPALSMTIDSPNAKGRAGVSGAVPAEERADAQATARHMKGNMRRRKVILGSAALIILPSAASARRDSLVRKWRLTQYDPHRCGFLVKGHPGGWERETRP